jgi:hypothetical protein
MKQFSANITATFLFLGIFICAFAADTPKLFLQLDKSTYISGETIRFKNTIINSNREKENVLYVDLCGEGNLFTSAVVLRKNNHWEGELFIPDSLQTGVYMVRAYTGNDQGIPTVVHQLVSVFNRFGKNEQNEAKKIEGNYKPYKNATIQAVGQQGRLKCSAEKTAYRPNEPITFSVENGTDEWVGGILFEVAKLETLMPMTDAVDLPAFRPSPEIKIFNGLTLRGRLINKAKADAVKDEVVFFSVADSIPAIHYAVTDSTGEFQFTLDNYFGEQTAIVQTQNKDDEFDIQLYPTFLLPPATIPYYIPTETEESEFVQLAVKRALYTKAYQKEQAPLKPEVKGFRYPFYGFTPNVVYPRIYVDLIDFEEIAKEILPLVSFKCSGNDCSIKIYDSNNGIYYTSPWVIVDGVPISDLSTIKKLNSLDINRVEVQSTIRCYGDLLIEGVMAIFTQKGDFSAVELPKNALKIKMETFFQPNKPVDESALFFRDVLHWDTHVDGSSKIEVKTSFETGNYVALVQSVDSKGVLHRTVMPFTIEPKK